MSKLYKDQSAAGGSKLLASVALGQSQQQVIATAKFENEVLDISDIFTSKQAREEHKAKVAGNKQASAPTVTEQNEQPVEKKKAGRPEKEDDKKSEKTIQNKEAMS